MTDMTTHPCDLDKHVEKFFHDKETTYQGWKSRVNELDSEITKLEREQAILKQKIREVESPFKVGDKIQWHNGSRIRQGRVIKIVPGFGNHIEWIAIPFLKDGKQEGATMRIREYNNPKKIN